MSSGVLTTVALISGKLLQLQQKPLLEIAIGNASLGLNVLLLGPGPICKSVMWM